MSETQSSKPQLFKRPAILLLVTLFAAVVTFVTAMVLVDVFSKKQEGTTRSPRLSIRMRQRLIRPSGGRIFRFSTRRSRRPPSSRRIGTVEHSNLTTLREILALRLPPRRSRRILVS